MTYFEHEGRRTLVLEDGAVIALEADGRHTITNPDGTVATFSERGIEITHPERGSMRLTSAGMVFEGPDWGDD